MKLFNFFILTIIFIGCNSVPTIDTALLISGDDEDESLINKELARPSMGVFIQNDFCACQNGEAKNEGYESCQTTCQEQPTSDNNIRLYLNFAVNAEIENSQFSNVEGYCSNKLVDTETQEELEVNEPECVAVFKDKDFGTTLTVDLKDDVSINGNSVVINNTGILNDRRYSFYITEVYSGEKSDSKDLQVFNDPIDFQGGAIKAVPINEYACIITIPDTNTSTTTSIDYVSADRVHFYYINNSKPGVEITTQMDYISCHATNNIITQTPNSTTPLIDNYPGKITLWDRNDSKFRTYAGTETTSNGSTFNLYVDYLLTEVLERMNYNIAGGAQNFFQPLRYAPSYRAALNQQSSTYQLDQQGTALLGYYLVSIRDPNDAQQRHTCPGNAQYNDSTVPLFQAIHEVVEHETEPLYLALRADSVSSDGQSQSVDDRIFVTKSQIENARFYLNSLNQEVAPTEDNIQGKKIEFYWPISTDNPRQKKPHQKTYVIQAPNVTNPADAPYDNRFGCVPKL